MKVYRLIIKLNKMTTKTKPEAEIIGQDGNVFNLIGICSRVLKKNGQHEEAKEMTNKIMKAGSYDEALMIMGEYCELC